VWRAKARANLVETVIQTGANEVMLGIFRFLLGFLPVLAVGYVVFQRGWGNASTFDKWILITGGALWAALVLWTLFDWIRGRVSPKELLDADSTTDDSKPQLPLGVAVLVHGTWGRGALFVRDYRPRDWFTDLMNAPWFHPRSSFSNSLRDNLPKQMDWDIRAFNWSGANSVKVRYEAAKALALMLREQLDRAEFVVVIAHSHGGNIGLMAIRMLGEASGRVHLITIATPFLNAFAEIKEETDLKYGLPLTGIIFIAITTICLYTPMIVNAVHYLNRTSQIYYVLLSIPFMIGLSYLLARFVVGVLFNVNLRWFPWGAYPNKSRGICWQERPFALAATINGHEYAAGSLFEERKGSKPNNPAGVLVLRGYDDEAALTLAAGAIATRLSNGAHFFLLGALPTMGTLVLIMHEASDLFGTAYRMAQIGYSAIFGLIMAGMLLPNIARTVFGREFLLGAVPCTVNPNSAPDSTVCRIWTLTPRARFYSKYKLRHSLYENPDCVTEIALWISSEVERGLSCASFQGNMIAPIPTIGRTSL
jgi:hypothetical protein